MGYQSLSVTSKESLAAQRVGRSKRLWNCLPLGLLGLKKRHFDVCFQGRVALAG